MRWRILWNDPATGFFTQQIGQRHGKRHGDDIVQTGVDPRGGSMRWTFSDITAGSFHWMAERTQDDTHWRREVEIRAHRV